MAAGLVQSADAKFSWGCTWLSRPGEHYCATHSSICPPYPYLLGFAGTLGCSQQVVQGCPILPSISRQFPPPLHPPLSQAWCKCISYLFWRYICFISYFFSNFRYWFCCRFLQSKCRGAVCRYREGSGRNWEPGLGDSRDPSHPRGAEELLWVLGVLEVPTQVVESQ